MKVHNFLPLFLDSLSRWEQLPSEKEFFLTYVEPQKKWLDPLFEDLQGRMGCSFYSLLEGLDWKTYRDEALSLDPATEERRVRKHLVEVESLLQVPLKGDVLLFGSFATVDGYARFHKGEHCVYLGVDESHGRGRYLDVLMTHELTHVARESRASVWEGFGLDPKMTHDEFVEKQPVLEHVFSEGFSCAVSEHLVPGEDPWNYAYQSQDSLAHIYEHGRTMDRAIREHLVDPKASYSDLYADDSYQPPMPRYAHYVWAWQWVKNLIEKRGGDPRTILEHCSAEFLQEALSFELKKS